MQLILALLVFTLFTLTTASVQGAYPLPDDLQIITPENTAQLMPLAQLGNAAPRGVSWSPDGQTLLAATDDGIYRYELNALSGGGEFFAGIQNLGYNSTETYATSDGNLLDGDSFEVLDSQGNQRFISDGSVIVTSELVGDRHILHFADAETLIEFGTMSASGSIVLSEDRRRAALWSGGEYLSDAPDETWLPYHMELWDIESNTLLAEDDYTLDYFYPPQFSGQWLIVGDNGDLASGSIQVWNSETGELVTNISSGYVNTTPTISPDGRFMLLEGYGAELISLDTEMPPLNLTPDANYEGQTYNGVFSADGALLAVETSTGVTLYDLSETPPQAYTEIEDGYPIAFGRQSHLLLTGNSEGVLSLWDVGDTSVSLRFAIQPTGNSSSAQRFSPTDDFLLTTDGRLIETATGETHYTFPPNSNPQFNIDWSYAAYWLNGVLTLFDTSDGTESVLMTIVNNLGRMMEINSRSGLALFYGDDLVMRVFDMRTGDLRFEIGEVAQAHFNENGTRLMVMDVENTSTTLWDVGGATPVSLLTIDTPIRANAFSADGHLFAFISTPEPPTHDTTLESYTVEVWDVDGAAQIGQQVIESRTLPGLSVSRNNQLLAVTLFEDVLFCPIALNDSTCADINFPFDTWLHPIDVIFSLNGEMVIMQLYLSGPDGANGRYIYVQSLECILAEALVVNGYNDVIHNSASSVFSPDSTLILTRDSYPWYFNPPPHLRLRDSQGQVLFIFDGLPFAAFSPDSSLIATGSTVLQLWDAAALRTGLTEPLVTLENHNITGIAFNTDGTLLFVYEQRRVTVWGVES
jgi:WD40 repeat protein